MQRDTMGAAPAAQPRRIGELGDAIVHQLGDDLLRRASGKERPPAQHLVEHAAEREDVRASVDAVARHLLRRHVAERPEDDVRSGARERRTVAVERRELEPAQGQPEIQDLDGAIVGQEHVLGLEVAMDDAARVRRGQTLGDRRANVHRIAPRHWPLRQPRPKRVPLEQLHDGDGHVVDDRELVNRQDAGVRERGDGPRLGLEAPPHLGIGGDVRRHDLDGDVAIEPRVARAIHLAHAAGPDGFDDLVLGEARAGRECRHDCRFPSPCSSQWESFSPPRALRRK